MLKLFKFLFLFSIIFLIGCNKTYTDEEKKELWENAQTEGEIISRSGTPFNLATQRELALSDAQNRLATGGTLLGNKGVFGMKNKDKQQQTAAVGLPINPYLWRASIETINFMPLSSTDPFAGVIITDWYTSEESLGERCKLNIFINGADLKTENLKVISFCQINKNNQWINRSTNFEDNTKLENAILNKAKKLKINSG